MLYTRFVGRDFLYQFQHAGYKQNLPATDWGWFMSQKALTIGVESDQANTSSLARSEPPSQISL